jgi:hypothetical protein
VLFLGAATVTTGATIVFLDMHLSLLMEGLVGLASLIGFGGVLFAILETILVTIEKAVGQSVADGEPVEQGDDKVTLE